MFIWTQLTARDDILGIPQSPSAILLQPLTDASDAFFIWTRFCAKGELRREKTSDQIPSWLWGFLNDIYK